MLSRGVPMFVMGDEIRRTQNGNNNAYCQDNEISWMDWSLLERNKETYHFFRKIIEFRKTHPILHLPRFFSGDVNRRGLKDISWHGTRLNSPGWSDADARALAFTLGGFDGDPDMHVMMNMYWDNLEFDIPVIPGTKWYKKIDTSEQSPCDVADQGSEKLCSGNTLKISGRSIVVLVSK
jgi:glycogen operon protein